MTARSERRRQEIARLVAARGEVRVEELAERFDASRETIRRDLTSLEDTGALLKLHGGAKRVPAAVEGSFDERMAENHAQKAIIGQKLSRWLSPGQLIFMDTGSTTLIAAEFLLHHAELQVVTNSIKIASALAAQADGPVVYLLGGRLERDNRETLGAATVAQIGAFNADCAVITVGAIHARDGVSDYSDDEAAIARAMIAQSSQTVVLADHTKFDRRAAHKVCLLKDLEILISDTSPGPALASALGEAGAQVL